MFGLLYGVIQTLLSSYHCFTA